MYVITILISIRISNKSFRWFLLYQIQCVKNRNHLIAEIVLPSFIFFSFTSSSWIIITTYVDDYLNGFLVTKPSRDAKRPIGLFPPKATSKIFIQSRFSLFSCRALLKHLRTRTEKNAGMNLDAHTWNRATNGDHNTSWIFCPEEKMIFPFRLYLLLLV